MHTVVMTNSIPAIPTSTKTEWKVKVASLATWAAALAGSVVLSSTVTDYVQAFPDWAEAIVYPSILAGVTWLSGRAARTRPGYISESTAQAVEKAVRTRLTRQRQA